jgi:hypothetical protein
VTILFLIVIVLDYLAYAKREQLKAKIWRSKFLCGKLKKDRKKRKRAYKKGKKKRSEQSS